MQSDEKDEVQRLRQELAEARREADARAAELRKLHEETARLRQWRADFSVFLKEKKNSALWRTLSTLRGKNLLDDFLPPPLSETPPQTASAPTPPLPGVPPAARKGWLFFVPDSATTYEKTPYSTDGVGSAPIPTFICDSLITRSANPLHALREIVASAEVGTEIWLFEPDAVMHPNVERTSVQHLLLDATEPNRPPAPHAVDRKLFLDVIAEMGFVSADCVQTWTQSNAQSCYHLALLKRVDGFPKRVTCKTAEVPGQASNGSMFAVLHANPFAAGAGGTEQIALVRTRAMAQPRTVLVFPNGPLEIQAAEIRNGDIENRTLYTFPLRTALQQYAEAHAEAEDLVFWLAREFRASYVLFDHLLNWPLRLPLKLKAAGLAYALMLHDYYMVCPSFNLIDRAHALCSTHYGGGDCSEHCLALHFAAALHTPSPRSLEEHQALTWKLLDEAHAVICPDESVRARVSRELEISPGHIRVIPHGLSSPPAEVRESSGPRMRIALLGNLTTPVKGSTWLPKILQSARELPIDWHVFGRFDGTLATPATATLTQHGPYERDTLMGLLHTHAIDVVLLPSLVEESFSLTLSEAWCAGIPTLVSDLGALGNRVRASGFGWTTPAGDTGALAALLKRLCAQPAERNSVAARMRGFTHYSPNENAAAYAEVLDEHFRALESSEGIQPVENYWLLHARDHAARLAEAYVASGDTRWNWSDEKRENTFREALSFTPARYSSEKSHVLMVDLTSPVRDTLQVFFGTLSQPAGAAAQSLRHVLNAGRNRIFLEFVRADLCGEMRLVPGARTAQFTLHDAGLRAV